MHKERYHNTTEQDYQFSYTSLMFIPAGLQGTNTLTSVLLLCAKWLVLSNFDISQQFAAIKSSQWVQSQGRWGGGMEEEGGGR